MQRKVYSRSKLQLQHHPHCLYLIHQCLNIPGQLPTWTESPDCSLVSAKPQARLCPLCCLQSCGQKEQPPSRRCCFLCSSQLQRADPCYRHSLLCAPHPFITLYRARTHRFHLVHPEHHQTLLTGFVASSRSCSRAARCKAKLQQLILGSCTLCVGVRVLGHLIHTLQHLLKAQKISPLLPLEPSPQILNPPSFLSLEPVPGAGVHSQHTGDGNLAVVPQEQHGFPQELPPEIRAQGRPQQGGSRALWAAARAAFPSPSAALD